MQREKGAMLLYPQVPNATSKRHLLLKPTLLTRQELRNPGLEGMLASSMHHARPDAMDDHTAVNRDLSDSFFFVFLLLSPSGQTSL